MRLPNGGRAEARGLGSSLKVWPALCLALVAALLFAAPARALDTPTPETPATTPRPLDVPPIVAPTAASGVDVTITQKTNVDDTLTGIRTAITGLFASPDWPQKVVPQIPETLGDALQPWLDLWGRIAGLGVLLLTPAPMIYGWRRATGRTDDSAVRWATNLFFTVLFLLAGPRLLGLLLDGLGIVGGALNRVVFGDENGFAIALGQILTAATHDWQLVVLALGGVLILIWGWQIVVSCIGGLLKLALLLALSPLEAVRGRLREWSMEAGLIAAYLGLFYFCALILIRLLSIPILLNIGSLTLIGGVWVLNDLPRRLAALWLGPAMENAARRRSLVALVRDGVRPVMSAPEGRTQTTLGAAMLTTNATTRRRSAAPSSAPHIAAPKVEKTWFEGAAASGLTRAPSVRSPTIANSTGLRPDVATLTRDSRPAIPVSGANNEPPRTPPKADSLTTAAPRTFNLEDEITAFGNLSRGSGPSLPRTASGDTAAPVAVTTAPGSQSKAWLRANRTLRQH